VKISLHCWEGEPINSLGQNQIGRHRNPNSSRWN